jgi:hypothetical protein
MIPEMPLYPPPGTSPHYLIASALGLIEQHFLQFHTILWLKQPYITAATFEKLPANMFRVIWNYPRYRLVTYSSISEQVSELIDLYEERMAICMERGEISEEDAQKIAFKQVSQQIKCWDLRNKII